MVAGDRSHDGHFDIELRRRITGGGNEWMRTTQCVAWSLHAEAEAKDHGVATWLPRIAWACAASAALSLVPVLVPFGDPFDLTAAGFAKNAGYFLWYCGTGWGMMWWGQATWANRLLGAEMAPARTVVLPTTFAILLFFVAYVLLGGPAPLGTLTLGAPCFVVSWVALWRGSLRRLPTAAGRAAGQRLLCVLAGWVAQLVLYAALTVAVMEFGERGGALLSALFNLSEFVFRLDFVFLIYGGTGVAPTAPQRAAARVLPLLFISLHLTYLSFLFPVLAGQDAVVTGALATLLARAAFVEDSLAASLTTDTPPEALAGEIFVQLLLLACSVAAPLLFGVILAYDHFAWQSGMFFELDRLCAGGVADALVGCLTNLAAGVLSAAYYAYALRRGRGRRGLAGPAKVAERLEGVLARSRFRAVRSFFWHLRRARSHGPTVRLRWDRGASGGGADGEGGTDDGGEAKRAEEEEAAAAAAAAERAKAKAEEEHDAQLRRYRVERALFLVRRWCRIALSNDEGSNRDGPQNDEAGRGLLSLVVLSLGAVNTVVGVCMLMKHDGMSFRGWVGWAKGANLAPYPLCPMLGECYAHDGNFTAAPHCD